MIKRWAIFFFWLIPGVLFAQELVHAAPKISVDKKTHDYGVVGQASTVEHQFHITNEGNAELHIHKIKSSCDCMAKMMGDQKIPVGSERILNVMFDTQQTTGIQRRSVELHTNSPESPIIKLELTGRVAKDYAVIPSSLHIKNLTIGNIDSMALKVRQFSDTELKVNKLDTSVSWLSAHWSLLEAEKGFSVNVEVGGEAPLGSHMEVLSIYFDQDGKHVIDVPVLVDVVQDIAENYR